VVGTCIGWPHGPITILTNAPIHNPDQILTLTKSEFTNLFTNRNHNIHNISTFNGFPAFLRELPTTRTCNNPPLQQPSIFNGLPWVENFRLLDDIDECGIFPQEANNSPESKEPEEHKIPERTLEV